MYLLLAAQVWRLLAEQPDLKPAQQAGTQPLHTLLRVWHMQRASEPTSAVAPAITVGAMPAAVRDSDPGPRHAVTGA
jgi:hypothetical protein